jgi:hypothetical protein
VWLAGGVVEKMAWPEWLLASAGFSSVGAAPVELRRGSAVLSRLAALRRSGAWLSPSGDRGVAAPSVEVFEGADALKHGDDDGVAGRRLFGAEWRRLPVRAGETPDPRRRGGGAAARRRDVLIFVFLVGVQQDSVLFLLFVLDLSVRTMF